MHCYLVLELKKKTKHKNDGMGTSQLYLTDERTDLEFLDKASAERTRGGVRFAIGATMLESACDKQQVDVLLSR